MVFFFDAVKPVIKNFKSRYHNISEALLSFVLQKDFIDHVIIGVETAAQLQENLQAAKSTLKVEMELPVIDEKILMPVNWPKQ
ncbi:MAG: aldo/keto reductase [Chitinophagaceae bacterium]|nr:aldo/keto reductase [Chitinophagaceae bacterium]